MAQKRLDTEGFIAKARLKHGDRYDYSKTVYVNQTTPVTIICPEHGEFLQRPNNHYMGAGCPVCSGNKRYNAESFAAKAKTVHGDKYDYSKVRYVNNKTKVMIICPKHGEFWQIPDKHLRGEGCPSCSDDKLETTNLERYGVRRPLQNEDIHSKFEQTCLEKYGTDNPLKNADVKQKRVETCMERYNVPHAVQADDVVRQRIETCRERYGGDSPFSSDIVRAKASDTIYKKYGVHNTMHLKTSVYRVNESKLINKTFHVSKPEQVLYEMLCEQFGKDDVVRQYCSDLYPFACDFYIKSRDMYIELNASWTHGGHWFTAADTEMRNEWEAKHTDYYDNAVSVWTDKDVIKRKTADENRLNYIVFWNNELKDAVIWFASGCPDGQDYVKEYSWLPDRMITVPDYNIELTGTHSNISMIAKRYQFRTFYEHEMQMWHENRWHKNISFQLWIYYNRYKYLGKIPSQLNDAEILRAFTISGIHKGYTVFDVSLMQQVIDKYDIKSVYDPCAGWGERMLCCHCNDIAYTGVDINDKLKSGHDEMILDYSMNNQTVIYQDSASYEPDKAYDAVITCPPYHNIEIYSDKGVENYDYQDFLEWWTQVVHQCRNVRYFCFQINNRYKDDMTAIVERDGFEMVETLQYDDNKSSHFTRKNGIDIKRECETMFVFRRKGRTDMKDVMSIASIKELREYMKLSQSEFAKYFGMSLRCLQGWEQGQRKTPAYVLDAFKKIVMYEEMLRKV